MLRRRRKKIIMIFSRYKLNSKKGNAIIDSLTALSIIVVFALITIFGFKLLGDLNDDFQAQEDFTNVTKQHFNTMEENYPSNFDWLFLTMLVLLFVSTVVFSYLIGAYPVFFIISIVLVIALLFVGGLLSNAYEDVMADSAISAASFPITNWVMTNLLVVVLVFAIGIGLALYGSNRQGGGF